MNPWLRLYRETLHDPKIVTLSDRQHRAWVNCLMMADDEGFLPSTRDMACHLRMTMQDAEQVVNELIEAGLVDPVRGGPLRLQMHGWARRQYKSDNSTERVQKFRKKGKNNNDETAPKQACNVSETPPDPDPDPDAETDSASLPPEPVTARAKVKSGMDLVREGLGKGGSVSHEVRRKVAAQLGIATADPLVALYESWPRSRHARDADALFVSTAPKLLRDASPEVVRACRPPDEPIQFQSKTAPRASSALRSSLARMK